MDGSTAMISAIAAGDAVITITASDGSASVSQGFRIDVPTGPKEATLVITRLLDADRNQISDPMGISGTIYAVLDVQSNDETWTDIALTLNGDTVTPVCRGSADASADVSVGPGLAAAGQVEIECALNTSAVEGECVGMPLMPKYANGEYELSAFLTTDADERRDVVASQPIALNNGNSVEIAFSAGSQNVLDRGVPIYGGPSGEGNMNTFHACPVSFDGTEVGKISLRALSTGADKAMPHQPGTSLSFMAPTEMPEDDFNGDAVDRESGDGFTWEANSEWNGTVEDEGPGGREHWVFVGEKIENAAGLDVSSDFATNNPHGPYYFDFKAPEPGAIHIGGADVAAGTHYSNKRYANKGTNTIRLSSIADMGVGVDSSTIMIGVGDGSAEANKYDSKTKLPDRTMTPFEAAHTFAGAEQGHVEALPEEDASCAGADSNGLGCYVAELMGLADHLGNAWMGGKTPASWLQTAHFGVDKTAPELDDIEPDLTGLVFKAEPEMEFEVRNPDLESGDDGTDLTATAMWGKDYDLDAGVVKLPEVGIDATVDLDASVTAEEGAKSVRVTVRDGARPPNSAGYTFGFTFDTTEPTYSIARTQADLNPGSATSVQVSVEGTVSDKGSNLEVAELRLLLAESAEVCYSGTLEDLDALEGLGADAPEDSIMLRDAVIPSGDRLGGSGKNKHMRELADGTAKSASLNSTFTIAAADPRAGPETFCFRLDVEDVARTAGARASSTGNDMAYDVGSPFTVNWPDDRDPPTPTYNIVVPTAAVSAVEGSVGAADDAGTTDLDETVNEVAVSLGGMNLPTGNTGAPAEDVTVTITAVSPLSVDTDLATDGNQNTLTFTPADFGDDQMVYISVGHDLNTMTETRSISLAATSDDANYDGVTATLMVETDDDDITLSVAGASIDEDAGNTPVVITAIAGSAHDSARVLTIAVGGGTTDGVGTDFSNDAGGTSATSITIPKGMTESAGTDTLHLSATDDAIPDESEALTVTATALSYGAQSGITLGESAVHVIAADIPIIDMDPDMTLSISTPDGTSVAEGPGSASMDVTVTFRRGAVAPGIMSITVAASTDGTACVGATWDATTTLRIDNGASSGTVSVPLTLADINDSNETCEVSASVVTPANKPDGTATYTIGTAELTIVNTDGSESG